MLSHPCPSGRYRSLERELYRMIPQSAALRRLCKQSCGKGQSTVCVRSHVQAWIDIGEGRTTLRMERKPPAGRFQEKVMNVFVLNMRGEPLMPCSPRKARILLRDGKAEIAGYRPFTIQLTIATGETVQEVHVGVDTGSKHIGMAVTSESKVLFSADISLRQDISSLLKTRRDLRRGRRYRKTRYRKARFLNRRRKDRWLPPSLESRVQAHFKWIDRICSLLPNPVLHIEAGKFDPAKMVNPEISGEQYQQGPAAGYHDVRYFVFARDEYTCQVCKKKNKILQTHHILFRSNGGTDRADNLITVCTDCHTHEAHQPGGILYRWQAQHKQVKQYKEPAFMNTLRRRMFDRYPGAHFTYGSVTTPSRKALGLEKSHVNDAIAITGTDSLVHVPQAPLIILQVRTKKRSLHEATPRKGRKEKNRTQKREAKNTPSKNGFHLSDRVRACGKTGYITGFTGSNVYIRDAQGNYITQPGKKHKQFRLSDTQKICSNRNWIIL